MTNKELLDFGAFLFRSGEESFRAKKDVELDKNIREYIIETFNNYKNKEK